jgi:hypothetical protein
MKALATKRIFWVLAILFALCGVVLLLGSRPIYVMDSGTRQPLVGATVTPIYGVAPTTPQTTVSKGCVRIDGYRLQASNLVEVTMTGYETQSVVIPTRRDDVVVWLKPIR